MARKPKESNIVPVLGTQLNTGRSLAGKKITLNTKKESFFGVDGTDIWLTPQNHWATVPENLDNVIYSRIQSAIEAGTIQIGDHFIPPIDREEKSLKDVYELIKASPANGLSKNARQKLISISRQGAYEGYTVKEVISFCLNKERSDKNRKDIIRILTEAYADNVGPEVMYQEPTEEEGIKKVTILSDGSAIFTNSKNEASAKIAPKEALDFID